MRQPSLEELKTFGAFAGIASLFWALYQAWGSYLQLDTSIQDEEDMVVVGASIENKLIIKRRLKYSLLLVSPELEDPLKTARTLAPAIAAQIRTHADIVTLRDCLARIIHECPQ